MKDLYIFGYGGFGREVAWLVNRINKVKPEWNLLGYIDDNPKVLGMKSEGIQVVGNTQYFIDNLSDAYIVCAIGNAKVRKKVVNSLGNVKFANLIDPSVLYSDDLKVGKGNIICAGVISTVNVKLNNHNIINLDCTIGHDVIIEDFVTLYPSVNVSGNVHLHECVEMGTGSQIIQGLEVGENSIIGAGAVVVRNIESNVTAVGMPAKVIKKHE